MKKVLIIMFVLTTSALQADDMLQQMFKLCTEQLTPKEDCAQDEQMARVSTSTAFVHGARAAVITASTCSSWFVLESVCEDFSSPTEDSAKLASIFVLPAGPWVVKYLVEATNATLERGDGTRTSNNISMQYVANKWAKAAGSMLAISLLWKLVYEYNESA